jgi:hypothetical protein
MVGSRDYGGFGVIFHSGASESSGVQASLHDVWGSGSGDVYAVGENGTILHRVQ